MRGNRGVRFSEEVHSRSIPACAGKPFPFPRLPSPAWVYPRVCGETAGVGAGLVLVQGLSPRVRGNLAANVRGNGYVGSIPACAGKPRTPSPAPRGTGVYPRVCGETSGRLLSRSLAPGLSPRVRGNPLIDATPRPCYRSIPACAGKPMLAIIGNQAAEVYPRVCGETRPSGWVLSCI